MNDPTEAARMILMKEINAKAAERAALEAEHGGPTWDTAELQRDFSVQGFAAPFVLVTRKSDGKKGVMTFQHSPRFYWGFEPS